MSTSVLVTGGRGKTGREVVAQLTGVHVRAGTRTPGGAQGTVVPVAFDWGEPSGWAAAVKGVGVIYLMRPDLEDAPERVAALLDMAPGAHVVLLSEQGAGELPPSAWERRVEAAVTERSDDWTVLRPSWFQQVFIDERFFLEAIRDRGELAIPSGGARLAWVDARDIAAVAVAVALDPAAHAGRSYTITGPTAVSVADAAEPLSRARGRAVRAADPAVVDAVAGLDGWLSAVISGMYGRVRDGVFGEVNEEVERVTGRPARALDAFVAEHADVWRGSAPAGSRLVA